MNTQKRFDSPRVKKISFITIPHYIVKLLKELKSRGFVIMTKSNELFYQYDLLMNEQSLNTLEHIDDDKFCVVAICFLPFIT